MATTRLLRTSKPLRHVSSPCSSSSMVSKVKCLSNGGLSGEKMVYRGGDNKTKPTVAVKAAAASTTCNNLNTTVKPHVDRGIHLGLLVYTIRNALVKVLTPSVILKPNTWKLQVQVFIERAIINCRFFTLFAVAGSLLGSALCFVEGCFAILESYIQYFNVLSQGPNQRLMVHLLMEAIDMFLVGTALFIFGVGLYVMFVRSKNSKQERTWLPGSNFFGLFPLKSLPTWVAMQSVSQAKSRIGHAVLMILQVGMLEKFKNTPLVTSLDLACFAGAVTVSSACIFLLSRLAINDVVEKH